MMHDLLIEPCEVVRNMAVRNEVSSRRRFESDVVKLQCVKHQQPYVTSAEVPGNMLHLTSVKNIRRSFIWHKIYFVAGIMT